MLRLKDVVHKINTPGGRFTKINSSYGKFVIKKNR